MLGIEPTRHAGQAQAKLDGHQPVYILVGTLCPPLEKQLDMRWRMGVRNSAHTLAKLATPFGEDAALRLSSVSHRNTWHAWGNSLRQLAQGRC